MAIAASMNWDVRSTGSDSNGGGFDPTSGTPGTNYAQQDSPQVTYTDIVIDATTNTKCTSAGTPFTSAHVGNVINVTSGTGFTVQRVQILSVTAAVATCDKSLGTLSSTGGNGKLGGGLLTIATALSAGIAGNTFNVKNGTFTFTSAQNFATNGTYTNATNTMSGYNSAWGDAPTGTNRPLITTATNSTRLFNIQGSGSNPLTMVIFRNIRFSNTAGTRANGLWATTGGGCTLKLINCLLDGFSQGINGDDGSSTWGFNLFLDTTEIKNCTGVGVINSWDLSNQSAWGYITNCYIHDNGSHGFQVNSSGSSLTVCDTIFARNAGTGFLSNKAYSVYNCNFDSNGADGIATTVSSGTTSYQYNGQNNIFWNNTGYGIDFLTTAVDSSFWRNNAYGSNTTAARHFLGAGDGDVTLTANPWTSSSTGDYSLNSTAGGGAACKAAGIQWS